MDLAVILAFLGKLHPAAVHFPIVCIVFAFFLETFQIFRKRRKPHFATLPLLLMGALSGVAAAFFGYLNSSDQQFFGAAFKLMQAHQLFSLLALSSLLFASLCILRFRHTPAAALDSPSPHLRRRFLLFGRLGVLVAFLLTLYGAHQGALLVHGSDYFVEAFQREGAVKASLRIESEFSAEQLDSMPAPAKVAQVDFHRDIEPLFEQSCDRCHGNGKRKGGLRMDSRAELLRGGESGPAIIPGNSRDSYLVQLVSGLDHSKIMPEKGEKFSQEDIAIVRAWIDQGAPWSSDGGGSAREDRSSEAFDSKSSDSTLALRVSRPPACKACNGKSHPIDKFLAAYFEEQGLPAPTLVTPSKLIRRYYLDILGRLPTSEEAKSSLTLLEASGSEEVVSQLLSREAEYAGAWLGYWNDLLRNDYTGPGFNQKSPTRKRKEITGWLKRALEKNMSYDTLVRQLIAPNQRSEGFVRGILWPGTVNPNERPEMQAAQNVGQVFLGINLKCASCHDSFTSSWSLEDSYSLASVFSNKPLEIFECDQATGEVAHARFLFPEVDSIERSAPSKQRKIQLAESLTRPENGRFARTMVNRMWAKLFGRGLQEPLDEAEEVGWNPELQDWMATSFVQSGFDLKELLKLILTSEAYRSVAIPAKGDERDPKSTFQFRGPLYRPLPAEAVLDTAHALFGVGGPVSFSDVNRITTGSKEKPKSIRLKDKGEEEIELQPGDWHLFVRIPVRKKRNTEGYPESELVLSSEHISSKMVESYRFDQEKKGFAETRGTNSIVLRGEGQLHLKLQKPTKLKFAQRGEAPVEMKFHQDIFFRAALLEHNQILASLGRPKRVQVISRRDSLFSSPRVLALATNTHWDQMVRSIGKQLKDSEDAITLISHLLGRPLSPEEQQAYSEELESRPENVIWTVLSSPDFLVIS